jgi:hypothetical protein
VTYTYEGVWSGGELLRPGVLLEMGMRSGLAPAEMMPVQTLIAAQVPDAASDLPHTTVRALSPRRTLVEKLFAVHSAVAKYVASGNAAELRRIGRHYYDLGRMLGQDDLRNTIGGDEFWDISCDVDERGRRHFPKTHQAPPDLDFRESPALFPPPAVAAALAAAYRRDEPLFLGTIPDLGGILDMFGEMRPQLVRASR